MYFDFIYRCQNPLGTSLLLLMLWINSLQMVIFFTAATSITVTLLDELGGIKDGLRSMNSVVHVVHVYMYMYVLNLHWLSVTILASIFQSMLLKTPQTSKFLNIFGICAYLVLSSCTCVTVCTMHVHLRI